MANKTLFGGTTAPVAAPDTLNEAGGRAYSRDAREALAQFAFTGTFADTFYASAGGQLDQVRALAAQCEPLFLGKLAVAARRDGYMKDMPSALLAMLHARALGRHADAREARVALDAAFPLVIDNGKMVRNFVQMVRSGQFGRRGFGTATRHLLRVWVESRSPRALFHASVGGTPKLRDIIALAHPRPAASAPEAGEFAPLSRAALYRYFRRGASALSPEQAVLLPGFLTEYEAWKKGECRGSLPSWADFRLLAGLPGVEKRHWQEMARTMGWQALRQGLNMLARHGAFEDADTVAYVAARLRDPEEVRRARVFPYSLLATYRATAEVAAGVPRLVRDALHDALEVATENVSSFGGPVDVIVDVSGSMSTPVTGSRSGQTSVVTCREVAALIAATVLRRNPGAQVTLVDTKVHPVQIEPRDTILTNAQKLAINGGGTDLGAGLAHLVAQRRRSDLVIVVSDNESWADYAQERDSLYLSRYSGFSPASGSGGLAKHWAAFKRLPGNGASKLVLIDLQPNTTTQAPTAQDVLNVGGFGDRVWETVSLFMRGLLKSGWVERVEATSLRLDASERYVPQAETPDEEEHAGAEG